MTKEKAPGTSVTDSAAPDSAKQSNNSADAAVRRPPIALLLVVIAIAICWWLFLGGLAFTTANPVTFNQLQIRKSVRLVVATVTKIGEDGSLELNVKEELIQGDEAKKKIRVVQNSLPLVKGKSYIFPLSRRFELGYTVTRTELPDKPPLIYPASQKAVARIKQKLKEWQQQIKPNK